MADSTGPTIAGYNVAQLISTFAQTYPKNAQRSLMYLDGDQKEELCRSLNHVRKHWKEQGVIPRTRNITAPVVEKSAKLFKDGPPVFAVYTNDVNKPDEKQTQALMNLLAPSDFGSFLLNFQKVVRLLSTGVVLVSYDTKKDQLTLDILHRANTIVMQDPIYKEVVLVLYKLNTDQQGTDHYRAWDQFKIYDIAAPASVGIGITTVSIVNTQPNPWGIVPIVPFYDLSPPRVGFWKEADMSLVDCNESYNLHLTESEWTMRLQKTPYTFHNLELKPVDNGQQLELSDAISGVPRMFVPTATQLVPGSLIYCEANAPTGPWLQESSVSTDMKAMDAVFADRVNTVAADWSVRLQQVGDGGAAAKANSGFQLIIMELPNTELRQAQQRQWEQSFSLFFRLVKKIWNSAHPFTFSDDAQLYTDFNDPDLPVDIVASEQVWDLKIGGDRASVIDYYMTELGMTKDEAIAHADEVQAFNLKYKPQPPISITGATPLDATSNNSPSKSDSTTK